MDFKWTPLRPKISGRPLLGASRTTWGSHFCASELMLKNVSKMYRNDGRFGDLGAGCPTVEAPSNLHGISIKLHGISIESPSKSIDSTASRTPTYILDALNQKV